MKNCWKFNYPFSERLTNIDIVQWKSNDHQNRLHWNDLHKSANLSCNQASIETLVHYHRDNFVLEVSMKQHFSILGRRWHTDNQMSATALYRIRLIHVTLVSVHHELHKIDDVAGDIISLKCYFYHENCFYIRRQRKWKDKIRKKNPCETKITILSRWYSDKL